MNKAQTGHGKAFESLCKSNGIKWAELAKRVQVAPQTMTNWRNRGVSKSHAIAVAKILNCPPSTISDIYAVPQHSPGDSVGEETRAYNTTLIKNTLPNMFHAVKHTRT